VHYNEPCNEPTAADEIRSERSPPSRTAVNFGSRLLRRLTLLASQPVRHYGRTVLVAVVASEAVEREILALTTAVPQW
jgi:hypothetical protein